MKLVGCLMYIDGIFNTASGHGKPGKLWFAVFKIAHLVICVVIGGKAGLDLFPRFVLNVVKRLNLGLASPVSS